jgi:two-component system, OmpR family, alkaline phosphatase synthesis response regulator PhoP
METGKAQKRKILIIDDDDDILDLLRYNLSRDGYLVKTLSESSAAKAVVNDFHPDLIILDLMMHPYNGIEVCRMVRAELKLPEPYIFFLTAKSDDYYQSAAFKVGGDEFVEKIIGLKPLMSKVSTVLKENFIIRKSFNIMKTGTLVLNRGAENVSRNGNKIILNKNEFEILFFLAQNEGRTISLRQIVKTLWGSTTFMDENTALRFMDSVRRKVGRDLIEEKRINLFCLTSQPKL